MRLLKLFVVYAKSQIVLGLLAIQVDNYLMGHSIFKQICSKSLLYIPMHLHVARDLAKSEEKYTVL